MSHWETQPRDDKGRFASNHSVKPTQQYHKLQERFPFINERNSYVYGGGSLALNNLRSNDDLDVKLSNRVYSKHFSEFDGGGFTQGFSGARGTIGNSQYDIWTTGYNPLGRTTSNSGVPYRRLSLEAKAKRRAMKEPYRGAEKRQQDAWDLVLLT